MKRYNIRKNTGDSKSGGKRHSRAKSGLQIFNHWFLQLIADGQRVERGEVRCLVLDVLSDRARHGYDIIREIAARSEDIYSPSTGVIYPTLHILEKNGYVRSYEENGLKLFELTGEGRLELEENREEITDTYERLCGYLPVLKSEKFQAMGKQIDRIFKSLKKTFQRKQAGTARIDDICIVLDEAATRIEKILNDDNG